MPRLPDDWKVQDVQVFPSSFGPSVELSAETGEFGRVLPVRGAPRRFDVVRPRIVPGEATSASYFQVGEVAYAVVAGGDAAGLGRCGRASGRKPYIEPSGDQLT